MDLHPKIGLQNELEIPVITNILKKYQQRD